jgi:hypothetical protein
MRKESLNLKRSETKFTRNIKYEQWWFKDFLKIQKEEELNRSEEDYDKSFPNFKHISHHVGVNCSDYNPFRERA